MRSVTIGCIWRVSFPYFHDVTNSYCLSFRVWFSPSFHLCPPHCTLHAASVGSGFCASSGETRWVDDSEDAIRFFIYQLGSFQIRLAEDVQRRIFRDRLFVFVRFLITSNYLNFSPIPSIVFLSLIDLLYYFHACLR